MYMETSTTFGKKIIAEALHPDKGQRVGVTFAHVAIGLYLISVPAARKFLLNDPVQKVGNKYAQRIDGEAALFR